MIEFINLQEIDYEKAVAQQLVYVEEVAAGAANKILFCTHPPVVTTGRKTQEGDVFSWKGPIVEVSRGGRATYHGPSQLVMYPIVNLQNSNAFPKNDVHAYLRGLEKVVVNTLKSFGIEGAEAKTVSFENSSDTEKPLELTGVWVGDKKIASIGVAIKKWVTYHGVAINVEDDSEAFHGINPCGYSASVMTSVEKVLNKEIRRGDVIRKLQQECKGWLKIEEADIKLKDSLTNIGMC